MTEATGTAARGGRRQYHDTSAVVLVEELRAVLVGRMGERGADSGAVAAETGISFSLIYRLVTGRYRGLPALSTVTGLARWAGYKIRLEPSDWLDGFDDLGEPMGDEGQGHNV